MDRWQQAREQRERMTEVEARAHRAVRQAQKMLPQWRSLVRVLARDSKIKVQLSAHTSMTDGETVTIKVPVTLGDTHKHEPELCGQRDEIGKPMCVACFSMEDVNVSIFHEVAHIIEDSIEFLSPDECFRYIKSGLDVVIEDDEKRAKILTYIENKMTDPSYLLGYNSTMGIAKILNEWLPLLVNVIEDIRVNTCLVKARPGIAKMFHWRFLDILMHGVEGLDGTVFYPKDKGPDGQLIFSAFFAGSGYDLSPGSDLAKLYDDEVIADLNDMEPVMAKCEYLTGIRGSFHLALEFLLEARKRGYFKDDSSPFDPPPEKEEEEEGQDDGQECEGEKSDEGSPGMSGGSGDPTSGGTSSGGGQDDQQEPKDSPQDDAGDEESDGDDQDDEQGSDSKSDDQDEDDEADDEDGSDSPGGSGDSDEDAECDKDSDGDNSDGDHSEEQGDESEDQESSEGDGDGPEADTPEDIQRMLEKISGHAEPMGVPEEDLNRDGEEVSADGDDDYKDAHEMSVLEIAVKQAEYFEGPAINVMGVRVHTDPENLPAEARGWCRENEVQYQKDIVIGPQVIGPATRAMRQAFVENQTSHVDGGRRRGPRLDAKTMGRRIPTGDPYIFAKRMTPDRRDHAVLIGLDLSGSTWNDAGEGMIVADHIKTMGYAQMDLCTGTGIKTAMYAHTGASWVDVYQIKTFTGRWGPQEKELLRRLQPSSANLDGHTLQFYRKTLMGVNATDKTLLYFTDGKMPAWNYEEELEVLTEEIKLCRQVGINLVGIGVGTDSPKRHGLDTIRCDRVEDIPAMITQLKTRLI